MKTENTLKNSYIVPVSPSSQTTRISGTPDGLCKYDNPSFAFELSPEEISQAIVDSIKNEWYTFDRNIEELPPFVSNVVPNIIPFIDNL